MISSSDFFFAGGKGDNGISRAFHKKWLMWLFFDILVCCPPSEGNDPMVVWWF